MMTVISLSDLITSPVTEQIWLVPGSAADFGEGKYTMHITDYLPLRGLLLAGGLKSAEADVLINQIKEKFALAGEELVVEYTAND